MLKISTHAEVRKKTAASEFWHISPECPRWPTSTYISLPRLPKGAKVCSECIVRDQQNVLVNDHSAVW